jgi:hypothetical protein
MDNRVSFENLTNAIVLQAVKDYREQDEKTARAIERFFLSDWFHVLTKVDPVALIEKLRKEQCK